MIPKFEGVSLVDIDFRELYYNSIYNPNSIAIASAK